MCEARKQRGLAIAAMCRISQKGKVWQVPSQSESGKKYTVHVDEQSPFCSCPDFESRGEKCKHIFAVEFYIRRETSPDGTETITQSFTITETIKKPTYPQNWPAYNAAQTNEKSHFQALLRDLCQGVTESILSTNGRPAIPLGDALFACIFKVYSGFSGRRFMTDMQDAKSHGFVNKAASYNTIFRYFENPDLTPVLSNLIVRSSLPLKTVETDFAVDSSGFSSSKFDRWYDEKYGGIKEEHSWCKAHIAVGVKTHVVTACEIHEKNTNDGTMLPALVETTAKNFQMKEVSGDKAYGTLRNFESIASVGADAFIQFRAGTTGQVGGLFAKAFGFFLMYREEFLQSYHKRSNVESAFSMMKRKFGDSVRSKTQIAMRNEVLAKVVCHNLCVLIQCMYEMGVEPTLTQSA